MSYTSNLYLIRHGESEINVACHAANAGDYSLRTTLHNASHSNHRLTEKGCHQASKIAELFKSEQIEFDRIATSSMIRAVETMLIATDGRVDKTYLEIDDLLSERTWGIHDHTIPTNELQAELWWDRGRLNALDWTPRGGPSYLDTKIRARLVIEKYRDLSFGRRHMHGGKRHTHTALFTHSEFIWFLEREILNHNNTTHPKSMDVTLAAHNCAVRQWQFTDGNIQDNTVRMRTNSKDALGKFGEWTTATISKSTREELWKIVHGHPHLLL
jgi:broad specificity phosphatase PhoE